MRASRGYESARTGGGALQAREQLTFRRPPEQGQFVQPMKDGNQGLGEAPAPKGHPLARAPEPAAPVPVWCCRTGQDRLRQPGRDRVEGVLLVCHRLGSSADFLLQQKQKLASQALLASLVSPNPSFLLFDQTSSVFLSKLRGLASAPRLWRQQLAKLRVLAQSHPQTGFT